MRTHQEIADDLARQHQLTMEIVRRENEAQAVRVAALQEECGAIGHIFGRSSAGLLAPLRPSCLICRASAPSPQVQEG